MYFKVGRISFSSAEFIKKQKHTLSATWSALITVDLGAWFQSFLYGFNLNTAQWHLQESLEM